MVERMTALNIKSDEAHRLAREIAQATGLSLTGAVISALRDKQAALAAATPPDPARAAALMAFGRKYGALARRAGARAEDDGGLYDAAGLPR